MKLKYTYTLLFNKDYPYVDNDGYEFVIRSFTEIAYNIPYEEVAKALNEDQYEFEYELSAYDYHDIVKVVIKPFRENVRIVRNIVTREVFLGDNIDDVLI